MKSTLPILTILTVVVGASYSATRCSAEVRLAKVFSNHMVLQQELPIRVFGSADPGEEVSVSFNGQTGTSKAGKDGRWLVELPAMKAEGKASTLTINGKQDVVELKDILLGEVWLTSGQSNMGREIQLKETIPGVRVFYRNKTVRGVFSREHDYGDDMETGWSECSAEALAAGPPTLNRAGKPTPRNSYGELAVRFAEKLYKELGVPVGVMNIAFAGSTASSWTPKPGLETQFPFGEQITVRYFNHKPGVMYQTHLHPVVPLSFRGVVWYQGEDDGRNRNYAQDLRTMIESWRKLFRQPDMPFYMIQIAQTTYATGMLGVYESQAWVMKNVPHTGLVPSNDLQDKGIRTDEGDRRRKIAGTGWPIVSGSNPHPPNKHVVAVRAANIALAETYSKFDREVFGPMYGSHEIADGKMLIRFKHVGEGLKTDDGKPLNWFQVAPPLMKKEYHPSEQHYVGRLLPHFVKVQAEIVGKDTVAVHLPANMRDPFWVSFAWHPLARHNLYNSEGLPAIPFRIWPGVPPAPK